jgi:hypothetical protein
MRCTFVPEDKMYRERRGQGTALRCSGLNWTTAAFISARRINRPTATSFDVCVTKATERFISESARWTGTRACHIGIRLTTRAVGVQALHLKHGKEQAMRGQDPVTHLVLLITKKGLETIWLQRGRAKQ